MVSFRVPAPSAFRPMHDPTTTGLEGLRIYDGDEVVFDGSDPTTYVLCETAEELEAAFAALAVGELKVR
jgi:hypothetical protein